MQSIACATRNWIRAGILRNNRGIYGRQFEMESDDDSLISIPSNELLIGEELLTSRSTLRHINPAKICYESSEQSHFEPVQGSYISDSKSDGVIPPENDDGTGKYKKEIINEHRTHVKDNQIVSRLLSYRNNHFVCPESILAMNTSKTLPYITRITY